MTLKKENIERVIAALEKDIFDENQYNLGVFDPSIHFTKKEYNNIKDFLGLSKRQATALFSLISPDLTRKKAIKVLKHLAEETNT